MQVSAVNKVQISEAKCVGVVELEILQVVRMGVIITGRRVTEISAGLQLQLRRLERVLTHTRASNIRNSIAVGHSKHT